MAGTIFSTASGSGLNAWGMRSGIGASTNYSINIADGLSGAVNALAGEGGNAYGLQGDYVTIDTMSGDITASAGASAYGLMASDGYANYSELIIGTLSGTVVATGTTGHAYGLYGENNVKITGDLTSTGKITATAGQVAYGIYAAVDDIIISGRLAGDVKASAASAYGLYAARGLTISNGVAAAGSVTATGATLALGIASNTGPLSIANGFAGSVTAEVTGVGAAYGLKGPGIGITGGLSGAVASTAAGAGQAYGLGAGSDGVSIDSVSSTGTVTATAGDSGYAYGLYGSSGDVSITGAMSGQITATAGDSGYAYGLYADGGSISLTGGLSGAIAATVGGAATSSGNAYGLWASAGITIDAVSSTGKVTATSSGNAYGLYASAGGISITSGLAGSVTATTSGATDDLGIAYGLRASGASGAISLGSLSGTVTATGGMEAYGLRSDSSSISITGTLSGTVTAKSTFEDLGYAVGLRAATSISIGEVSGTISATTAGTLVLDMIYAYGLHAGGNINGGDADIALLVSGTISARAYGPAYAVYSESGAVNLYVTGALEGVNTHDAEAYAIYAGGSGSSVTLDLAAAASSSLIGKVHLNGGSVTLLGANSADNLFEGVTDLVVGDGVAAASWTLDPEYANRSSFTNLTINAGASLSINEFVSITSSIDNDGALIWDTVAGSTTYAGVLSGSGSLTKEGDHTLTLSGIWNSYSGTTTVSEGTLQANVARAFSANSAVNVASGATLDLNNFNQTIAGLSGGGLVALGSATLTVQNAVSYQYDGVISGTGGLTKTGAGTLTLAGVNTYTGATTVSGGILQAGAADIIASSSGVSVASGAVFDLADYDQTITLLSGSGGVSLGSAIATTLTLNLGSADSTFAGVISGAGTLSKAGSGTLTLSGANTYTGDTAITAGTLRVTGSLASQSVAVAAGSLFDMSPSTDTTYAGVIEGEGAFRKSGAAILTLSGSNTYSGTTTVSEGTLQAGAAGAFSPYSAVNVAAGATLDLNDFAQTIQGLSGNGDVTLGSATLTVQNAASYQFDGVISETGGLTKSGTGTLTLGGANTYTGATTVSGGILQAGAADIIASSSGVSVASGAVFDLNGYDQTFALLSGSGGVSLGSAIATTLTLNLGSADSTFAGVISGAGTLSKAGSGTLTLSGANTYTGDTAITAGTLRVTGSLASQSVAVAAGSLFDMSPSTDTTYAGVIEGEGAFRKSGAAILTLSGSNTYSGTTTVSEGTLQAGAAGAFSPYSAVNVAAGATLDLNDFAQTIQGLSGNGDVTLGSATLTVQNAASYQFDGVISETGGLTKSGTGTLTLGGANTYTGATTVSDGILQAGAADIIASSSGVSVASGAVFDLNGYDQTFALLSGSGGVTLGSNAATVLTLNIGSTGAAFAGAISGAGGLAKTGSGILTLSGANTYTGDTAITAGTLRVTGALASQSVDVAAGSLFDFSPATNTTYAGVIEGAGDFQKSGAAILTLSGSNTYSGTTTVSEGTLQAGAAGAFSPYSAVNVAAGATLDLNDFAQTIQGLSGNGDVTLGSATLTVQNAASYQFDGVISETGGLTKSGTGTLTLGGANTYTGATTVSDGILQAGAADIIASSSGVSVASGAVFDLADYDQTITLLSGSGGVSLGSAIATTLTLNLGSADSTFAGVISGAGTLSKAGSGTLTLSGANTYTGDTAITAGTLRVTGSLASQSVAVAAGSLFDMSPSTDTTYAGVIEGEGAFRKSGAAILTLSGSNTYSGTTTVSEGTLQAGAAGAFSPYSAVNVAAGATLDLNDFAQTIQGLSGNGDVTLGSATLTVQNAASYQFDGVISETGGLTKSGTGTLTLGGANTYTGATTVSDGILQAGAADIIASSSGVSVASGAVFDLNGYDQTFALLSGSGGVTLGSNAATVLTLNIGSTGAAFAGAISGAGGLAKTGSGILTLSGANTYTGDTAITAGTLRVTGALASQSIDMASGTLLDMSPAVDTLYAGVISGAGNFQKSGAATLTLSGNNTYTGATTVAAGTLGVTGALATSSINVASGATLNFSGSLTNLSSLTNSGTINLTNSLTFTDAACTLVSTGNILAASSTDLAIQFGTGDDSATFGPGAMVRGIVDGGGGDNTLTLVGSVSLDGEVRNFQSLIKDDSGTWTIGGDVDLGTGTLTVSQGTLILQGGLTASGAAIASGGLLDWSPSSDTAFAGVISVAGNFQKSGAAILTLSGSNTYTGATAITDGTLRVTGSLASQSVAVAAGSLFDMSPSANTTYAGVISGAGNFQKSGAATLTLSGNNIYTGATAITDGTLRMTGSLASASVAVSSGALFDFSPTADTTNAGVISGAGNFQKSGAATLTLSGNNTYTGATAITAGTLRVTGTLASQSVAVSSGSLFDMSPSTDTTYAGVISGAGNFQKSGAATLTLSGNNTYAGATAITAGTLRVTGSLASQLVAVSAGALFDMSPSANTTFAGVISGAGGFQKSGAATLTLSGANTYTGDTTVSGGTLSVTGSLTSLSVAVADGALFDMSPSADTTYAGVISGAGDFQKSGTATLKLSGANTYTGDTTVAAGTLSVTGSLDSMSVEVADGALFDMSPSANTTYAGVIAGVGDFQKSGAGILTLSGANTYTGDTAITAGTLRVTGSLASASVAVAAGALFDMSPSANTTYAGVIAGVGDFQKSGTATLTLSGANTYTGDTAITAGTLRVTGSLVSASVAVAAGSLFDMSPSADTTYTGVIAGAGDFQKSGTGILTLSGANTYTGDTTVAAGTLSVTGSLATTAIDVASGATLAFSGTLTGLTRVTNAGTITLTSALTFTDDDCTLVSTGSILAASATDVAIQFGAGDDSATFGPGATVVGIVDGGDGDNILTLVGSVSLDGAVRNFQSLIKEDSGSWTIGGDVDLGTGTLAVSQGTLTLGGGLTASKAAIASNGLLIWSPSADTAYAGVIEGAGDFQKSGAATLTLSGANTYTGSTTVAAGTLRVTGSLDSMSVQVADGGLFDMSPSVNTTYAGVIAGAGGFQKSGAATLTLSGANTYTGDTTVAAGTLSVTGSLASASVDVAAGSLFDMSPLADTTYAGVIEGAGDFQKSGAATLTLSGVNTYTGDTTVAVGTLSVTGSLASQSVAVASGALFDFSPTADTTYAGVISGVGDFQKSGTATLTLSGANTYTGDTTVAAGTLSVTGSLASASVAVAAGSLLDMSPSADTTYTGVIAGAGDFQKSGAATLTLSGVNTYTGDTTVAVGTLSVTGSLDSMSVEVADGALFDMSPSANTTYAGVISGAGDFQKSGTATLTLSGANTYTGGTTVAAGTLSVTGSLASASVAVAAGSLLDMSPSADTTYTGVIAGAGDFKKSGAATLILSGANTYTGSTTVAAGTLRVTGSLDSMIVEVADGGLFDMSPSANTTYAGVIEGAGDFQKSGTATLTLSAANTYTGDTTVAAGTLSVTGALASQSVAVASGGLFDFSPATNTTYAGVIEGAGDFQKSGAATLTLSGVNTYTGDTTVAAGTLSVTGSLDSMSVEVADGALFDMSPSANTTYAGVISGAGDFQKSGTATLTLSGANTYTGDTTVAAGTLSVTGSLASQSVAVASGGLFDFSPATNTTYAGVIEGAGDFQKSGTATLTLSGVNTYTGDTTVAAGTLSVTGSLDSMSVEVADGALFDMSPSANTTYAGVISGAGDFQKSGTATLTLSGANTYTGSTTVAAGTLSVTGSLATTAIDVASGATLAFSGTLTGLTRVTNAGTITLTSALTFTDDDCTLVSTGSILAASATDVAIQFGAGDDSATFGPGATVVGIVDGGDGDNILTLVGSVSLDGAVRNFQSLIKEDSGSWTIGGDVDLGTGTLAVSEGTLTLGGGLTASVAAIASNGLLIWSPSADTTYAGVIEGAGDFQKSGTATLTLSGVNTYTGDTTVAAGTLRVTGSLASASVDVAAGSLFDMSPSANTTYAGVIEGAGDFQKSGTATLTLSGVNTYTGDTTVAAGTLRVTGSLASASVDVAAGSLFDMSPSANTTYAGVIEGAGDFQKSGTATLMLSGVNSYTGDTTVAAGTLRVTGSLASASVDVAAGSLFDMSPSADTTYAGVIEGAGDFQKSGTATLTLSGANTYTGDTTVAAGTLSVTGSLASASVDVAAGSLFDMSPSADTTYAGVIEGAGDFQKSGAATLTLSGANTYTGATTVAAGTLGVTGSLASQSVAVTSGALFDMSPTTDTTYAGVIEGAGDFQKSGTATLTLSGANTYTGDTTVAAGTLSVTGSLASASVAVADGALFDMSPSADTTYAGVIEGAGDFQKSGAVTLTLSGANTYTGDTTVAAGTLSVTGSLPSQSVAVTSGALFDFSPATNTTYAGVIEGAGDFQKSGTATLTLSGANTHTGDTAITAGTLRVTGSLDSMSVEVADGALFDMSPAADTTYAGVIEGAGDFQESGTATLTLSGANTYTGDTSITAGTLRETGSLASASVAVADGALFDMSPSANTTYAGVIAGAGDFQKSGAATLTLSGVNTYTGDTTVAAGILRVTGSLASASVDVAAGSLFDMSPSADTTYAGVIEGAGDFQKSGAATLTLSGANTYTGDTTVAAGTLSVTGSLATTAIDVASGATLAFSGTLTGLTRVTNAGTITLTSALTFTDDDCTLVSTGSILAASATDVAIQFGAGDDSATFGPGATVVGIVDGGDGDNILTLVGSVSLDGAVRNFQSLIKEDSGSWTIGGDVDLGTGTLAVSQGTLTLGGGLTAPKAAIASNGLLIWSPSADTAYAGVIEGAGDFQKSGAATLTLSGANTYTGDTTVAAGTLSVTGSLDSMSVEVADGALFDMSPSADTTYAGVIAGAGDFQKSGAATLTLSGVNTYTGDTTVAAGTLSVTGSLASQSVDVAAGALFDMSPSADTTYAGVIEGAGDFQKSGTATLTLSGVNTYTGDTTVAAGTLSVTGSLATTAIDVASGATLAFSGTLTGLTRVTNAGTITLTSALTFTDDDCTLVSTGSILAASATDVAIQFGAGDDSATFGPGATVVGIVDGGDGDNILTLVGSVSLDGAVRNFQSLIKEDSGSWTIGGDVDLGTGILAVSEGTLTLGGGLTASVAAIASNGLLIWSPSADTTYAGVIEGAGDFQKSGAATLTLSGVNTYTGSTTVAAGTLSVTGSLDSISVEVADGALFDMSPSADTTYAGVIEGAGDFQKSGTATLTLSGANTYSGATTVAAGTLSVTGSLASQSVAVASGGLFDFSPATNTTYAGVIEGAGDFQKSGAATLTLSGANTYTGDTTVAAGTLSVTGSLDSMSVEVADGALFDMSPSADTTYAGVIEGAGDFQKSGTATLTLSGANTYSGATTVAAGTLSVTGSLASQSVAVASGGLFDFSPATNTTYAGVIEGAGDFQKSGAATLTLSGANTYTGSTTVAAGTLSVTGSLASASVAVAAGALFDMSPSADTTYAGVIEGAGDFQKSGAATLTLSGANTYTGDTAITAGTLRVTGSLDSMSVEVADGSLFDMSPSADTTYAGVIEGAGDFQKSGTATLTLSGVNTYTGDTTVAAGTLSVTGSLDSMSVEVADGALFDMSPSADTTYAGVIEGAGDFQKSGAATLTLSGANTYTGDTAVAAGTLSVTGSLASTAIDVASGATLAFSGTLTGLTRVTNAGTITLTSSLTFTDDDCTLVSTGSILAASATDVAIQFGAGDDSATFGPGATVVGIVDGGDGDNILTLVGSVSLDGAVRNFQSLIKEDSGSWTIGGDVDLGTGTLAVSEGTLTLGGGLTASVAAIASNGLLIWSPSADTTYAGVIEGAGDFQKSGAATLTLSGANIYTGDTTVAAGTLSVTGSLDSMSVEVADGSLFDMSPSANTTYAEVIEGAGDFQKSGAATLTLSGANTYTGDTTVAAGTLSVTGSLDSMSVEVADGALFDMSPSANTTYAGVIEGAGDFQKSGTATLTLSGANTYTGDTTVAAGTLSVTGSLDSMSVEVADGSLFDMSPSANTTYAGVIEGAGDFQKSGTATLTLSGANTYTGDTTVAAGTLRVTGSLASQSVDVASGGLFDFSPATNTTYAGVIAGAGDFQKSGAATLTLSGVNTYTGDTTVAAGTLRVTGSLDSMSVEVADGALFDMSPSADTTYAGVIEGAGDFQKSGTATLTLSGANTYTGDTRVAAGTLSVTGSLASASVAVAAGSLFDMSPSADTTYAGVIAGAGDFQKSGTATLTLSGANTYTGDTTVAAGTLSVTGSLDSMSVEVADGALFDMSLSADTTYSGVIEGAGDFQKSGAATLTLAGANTYTGDTTVATGTLGVTGSLASASVAVADGATLAFSGALTGLTRVTNAGTITLTSALTFTDDDCTLVSTGSILAASATDVAIQFGAGDDSATFGPGATVVGIVDGGDGDNILTLVGSVSLDGAVRNFQSLIKEDSGSWTIGGDVDLGTGTLAVSEGTLTLGGGLTASVAAIASNGLLIWSPSADTTYAGVIAGAGDFQKSGTATLTLSGANTYTGSTTVAAGTLRVTGSLASASVAVAAGSLFDMSPSADTTYAGVIAGAGDFQKSGAATLTLSGANTYTGDTTVAAGTLRVTGSLDSMSVEVGDGALFDMSPSADTTYAGVIAGAGDFQKSGTATLTLSGANTYTGDTTVAAGTLRLGAANALPSQTTVVLADVAGAIFDINDFAVTIAGLSGGGDTGGEVDFGSGTLTIDTSLTSAFAGVISGTGNLVKTGSGTQTLSGDSTYTGYTLVSGGTLDVTGTLASQAYQVDSGATLTFHQNMTLTDATLINGTLNVPELTLFATGTLSGSGTITGDVESYGLISPGNSPGTLTIAGNLYLGAGSTLFMEITPYANDLLAVSGTTTIAGGTLSLDVAQGYYSAGQTFTLLTSAGGITGAFDTITIDDHSQFLVFTVDVGDTAIIAGIGGSVSVTRLPYTIVGTSRNSMAAAAGLTGATLLATPSMQAVLATIDFTSLGEVARGLRQMSPEPYSAMNETAFSSMRLFSDTIRDRSYARRNHGDTLLTAVSAGNIGRLTQLASAAGVSDAGSGLDIKGTGTGMALFVKPVGQYQSVDNGHNRTGFQSWQYGVMAGGDAQVTDNFLAGFQVGWVHSDLRFKDDATSTGYADAFLGGVYASATAGGFYADGLVQAGAAVNHLDRRIEFGSIAREPTGKYTSFLFGASLSTGYDWTFGDWKAGPVGTLDYGYVSNPGFAESDPDLGLTVQGFTGNSLKTGLGAKISGTFTAGETTTVSPDLALRWGHEFLNDSTTISARYNGSPTSGFTSRTGDPARDSLLVDAGVSFGVSESTKLYVRYSGEFLAQGTQTQAGAVGVRYEF
ncbi:autotransporter-associated beta strand repeat-containing protein [Desulfolutivibrio sulfoxidireducens]|uniref:autotransporter-associated beta strand repeat-containing protein n=1 Tax=Desulfolutivibrio sulfoxidireducens TaxID=2773299 RepID=UPI00159E0BA7|nr:autotransporter-associated beta strand repeat-containing protein [Desulfolutivibrio sulfoxidireducens]